MLSRREFLGTVASAASGTFLASAFGDEWINRIEPRRCLTDFFRTTPMIGRVTGHSAVVNLVTSASLSEEVHIRVRSVAQQRNSLQPAWFSPIVQVGDPLSRVQVPICGLRPNKAYSYCVEFATASDPDRWLRAGHAGTFRSQRTSGRSFDFCVVADPHWGASNVVPGSPRWWTGEECLRRILEAQPFDFMIDLGDSPYPTGAETEAEVLERYFRYRDAMAPIARAMPAYLVLGNHEQEAGFLQRGTDDPDPPGPSNQLSATQYHQKWATKARLLCIPNPHGDTYPEGGEGAPGYDSLGDWLGEEGPWNEGSPRSHLQNFYAWTWGDALFVTLDPYRATLPGSITRPNYVSQWSLGPTQLQWLEDVLSGSSATWKFILCHHQVGGGLINGPGRRIFEGGTFSTYGRGSAIEADRPGTEQAIIHDLMQQYGAQFFVYGHDHAFCHSVKDGIHYLCCGRPTFLSDWWSETGMRRSYGSILNHGYNKPWINALYHVLGYTRFRVEPNRVTVQWIRTGYSFAGNVVPVEEATRDWLESWAGREYLVDSPWSVTVTVPPKDVDAVRTVGGAQVPGFFEPPPGLDYQAEPGPMEPAYQPPESIPLDNFPESVAVVDAVPELVYEVDFEV